MESVFFIILGLVAVFCAYRAMLAQRLLSSILYLACVSAAVSVILYLLGAQQVAVIELSVGAGLVTVLLVYALSVVGDDASDLLSVIPKPLAVILVGLSAILVGLMIFPLVEPPLNVTSFSLTIILWQQRVMDVWIQIALIFSGVLGVLGLLSEKTEPVSKVQDTLMEPAPARSRLESELIRSIEEPVQSCDQVEVHS
jgi:uncharacterized MnhB-related membrane protein